MDPKSSSAQQQHTPTRSSSKRAKRDVVDLITPNRPNDTENDIPAECERLRKELQHKNDVLFLDFVSLLTR
jgi:hypothetical protein